MTVTEGNSNVENNVSSGQAMASVRIASGSPRINVDHIYSLEPLRIKTSEHEEPRAPTTEESDMLVRSLFSMYKQQRQQVSH